VPESLAGAVVAIADKLDTLAGCFGLGLIPSGSQDPYALRRSAMGVVATLLAHNLDLSLASLARLAVGNLAGKTARPADEAAADVREFLVQRVRHLLEEKGFRHDCIEAVLGGSTDSLPGLADRAVMLQEKLDTPELQSILTPFTRAAGLVRNFAGGRPDPERFETEAERVLYQAGQAVAEAAGAHAAAGNYSGLLSELASLQPVIDSFFGEVMVMVEDEMLRNNRLSLLAQVRAVFLVLGDLSKITQKK
jgi:glycyl-tRNA synthetase beta chain